MKKWYQNCGSRETSVIISSRIRLARNLRDYPFPNHLDISGGQKVVDEVKNLFRDLKDQTGETAGAAYRMIEMKGLSTLEKVAMMEEHTISYNLINSKIPTAVLLNEDESMSMMVNEEDHLRIQAMGYGADLETAYGKADALDDYLEEYLDYAYSSELGYLTACPTNVGTGLRASYMIHVPALEAIGQLRVILEAIGKFGITYRGLYGESTEPSGSVYQMSNQVTLGLNEKEIIDNLNSVTTQVVNQELAVRDRLLNEKRLEFEDSIYRSYGILKHARILSSKEAMTLLSELKLGIDLGILKTDHQGGFNILDAMTNIQSANLQKIRDKAMDATERDIARASYIRSMIPDIKGG